ncbi:MAG: hypothetical protein JJE12_14510 [Anaerolineales bacterium]|nr:hypothetical protein [Anaerolineales bacterium]
MKVHAERPTPPLENSREGQRNTMPESQAGKGKDTGLMWKAYKRYRNWNCACPRKKVVVEPYEGKPHVRFEVAGDGNQDMVVALRHSQEETESNELLYLSPRRHPLTLPPDSWDSPR